MVTSKRPFEYIISDAMSSSSANDAMLIGASGVRYALPNALLPHDSDSTKVPCTPVISAAGSSSRMVVRCRDLFTMLMEAPVARMV